MNVKTFLFKVMCVLGAWLSIVGFSANDAQAQSCPAGKFCYYIPAGLGTPPGYSVDWDLIIASSFGTVTGSYKIGTAAAVPFVVTPATPSTVPLSATEGVTTNYGVAEKRGIYIEADSEALNVVRRLIVGPWQSSASIKDHTRSLGRRFRLAGYSLNGPNTADTGFDMVSVYAPRGGTVTFTAPPGATLPFWEGVAGATVSVSLAAGETYLLRTRIPGGASCDIDITGALVESTEAISVTTGGRGWGNAAGGKGACGSTGCGDDGEDHIFPVSNMGTQYIVNQYNTNIARIVAVVADENGTGISINGASVTSIDAGETYYFRPTGTTYIETSKNAYVYQNAGRNACEMGLAFVPPVAFGSSQVNTAAFNVSGTGTANILIEDNKVNTLLLDGVAVVNPTKVSVPTRPEWSVVTLTVSSGFHAVAAGGDFQLGLATGTGGTGLFAYYNIFNAANCGNGQIDANEGCDDSNRTNGDGCSSNCKIEVGTGGCNTVTDCVAGAQCDANNVCVECLGASDCNDGNDCTTDTCGAGVCNNAPLALGDTCAGGVCSGNAAGNVCVTCVDNDPNPGAQDAGCPAGSPVCDVSGATPQCLGCNSNADCNDGNECTTNTCNAGTCESAPVAAATTCNMGNGVCNGSNTSPACEECIDDSAAGQDSGCNASTPFCDRSGAAATCVGCLNDSQCGNGELCDATQSCSTASVAINTPADNSTTNDDTPALGGTANAESVVTVVIDDGNGAVFTTDVTATGGTWSVDSSQLPDGVYIVTATISANGGPVQDSHIFTINTVVPTLSITSPTNNQVLTSSTPAFAGTSEVGNDVNVVIRDSNGTIVDTYMIIAGMGDLWSQMSNNLPDGDYTIEAQASNSGGNTSGLVGPLAFAVDTTPPAVLLVNPADNSVTNDPTPTINGTTEIGASVVVTLYDSNLNPIQTLAVIVDGAGSWSVDALALGQGDYAVQATATDAAGNSADSALHVFTVDTTEPGVTIATPVDNANLNMTMVAGTGSTEAGSTVDVIIRDAANAEVFNGQATVDQNGLWSIPAQTLTDGTYTIEATATDPAGNTSRDTHTFSVDSQPPAVTLDTPSNNAQLNDNTPTFGGTTEDNATVVVTIRDSNGAVVQTLTTTGANNSWSVDALAALLDGTYTAEAVATDGGGNMSMVAGPVTFSIDTVTPDVTLDAPTDGAVTTDNTPAITGALDDNTATLVVTLKDNGGNVVQLLNPVVDAQGNWTVDAAQLADGDYTVEATASDAAGNSDTDGPNGFTVDSTAPTVTLDTPADASFTNDDTPEVSGSAEVGSTVVVLIKDSNGTVVETLTPVVDGANGSYTIDTAQLAEGTYSAEATATDAAGNVSALAGPNGFEVDLTDPAVVITNPADGSFTSNVRPDFSGTTEVSSSVSFVLKDAQGNTVHTATVTSDAATGAWTVDNLPTDLTDGAYTIEVTATDRAGNTGNATSTFTVDTSALPLDITAPTAGEALSDTTPDVTGTTAANTDVTVTITDANGAVVETLTATSDANGDWTTTLSMLADGGYVATAEATNPAGTTSTATVDFTVDTMAPPLTLDAPADGTITNDDTPAITGTSEPGATVTVIITDANGTVVETLTPVIDGMGGWTIDAAQLPDGVYTIDASASDDAGNTTTVTPVSVTIDTTAPTLTIDAPTMGQIVGTRDVDVSGKSDAGQVVTVEVLDSNGVVVDTQTATTDANGDWTIQTTNLANGGYTARAKTTDDAGNDASAEQTFSVDSDEALIQIATPADGTSTNVVRPGVTGQADADATVRVVVKDSNGVEVIAVDATVDAATGTWTADLGQDLTDGAYTIEATSTRPNGKMATATSAVTVDTMAPVTTIATPADGMVGNMNQPEITGTSEPGATVDVTVTNTAGTVVFTGQVTADDQGNWTVTPDSPLADDTYTVEATSTDVAGNQGTPVTSGFSVDTNAPLVTVISPSNGETVEDSTPTISGTAEPGATVVIIVDGDEVGQATADDQGAWTFDLPEDQALGEGDHTIEATTTDDGGNMGTSGEITITFTEPKAPVTITSPGSGATVEGPTVTITGTGEPGEEVTVTVNGNEEKVTVDENGNWSVDVNDVPDGETTITAKSGDDEATITVTVDAPDSSAFVLQGAGCSSTNSSPTSSLWLLGLLGFGLLRRRRKKA